MAGLGRGWQVWESISDRERVIGMASGHDNQRMLAADCEIVWIVTVTGGLNTAQNTACGDM